LLLLTTLLRKFMSRGNAMGRRGGDRGGCDLRGRPQIQNGLMTKTQFGFEQGERARWDWSTDEGEVVVVGSCGRCWQSVLHGWDVFRSGILGICRCKTVVKE
jgi:hypothetical protein